MVGEFAYTECSPGTLKNSFNLYRKSSLFHHSALRPDTSNKSITGPALKIQCIHQSTVSGKSRKIEICLSVPWDISACI